MVAQRHLGGQFRQAIPVYCLKESKMKIKVLIEFKKIHAHNKM